MAVHAGCVATQDPVPPTGPGPAVAWTHADADAARSLPFADDDLAVFLSGFARRVVALDAQSGRVRWTRNFPDGPSGLSMPTANVLATPELVLVPAWDLYALDRATGAIRWQAAPPEEYPAASSIVLAGDLIVAPGSLRHLYAIELQSGRVRWALDVGGRPFAPVIEDGVIYVGTHGLIGGSTTLGAGHAVAVRLTDGQRLWSVPIPNAPDGPWLGGVGRAGVLTPELYIVASTNRRVYGINRVTGQVRWEYVGTAPYESGVALLQEVAVVADMNGEYVGLDAKTGVRRWRAWRGGSSVTRQITTDGECAYISVGAIECIDVGGSIRWDHGGASNGGPSYTTAVRVRGRRLFAGSVEGFHALTLPP